MNLFSPILSISLLILLLENSCNTTEPPGNQTLFLKLEDVSCTEAWIQFSSTNIQIPNNITLYINNQPKKTINLTTADTLLYIDSLLPNQNYTFQASSIQNPVSSNKVTATTLDTTSHNFTWQTFTFGGQAGSCALYDVAIINENNIWAVGEIYMLDSLGRPDQNAYNAVHWNGQSWELKKIRTNACGGVDYPPIKAIFAFSSNDILFAHIDGSISHFNGIEFTNDCSLITQLNGSANKMWGISKDDFYVVSGNGFIAHYQNGSWTRIESGSNWDNNDVYGYLNSSYTQYEILCAATDPNDYSNSNIFKITNKNNLKILDLDTHRLTGSVWTHNGFPIFVCGDGLFSNKSGTWKEIGLPANYVTSKIRGLGLNDIFICGAFGLIAHFNGQDWVVYNDVYNAVYSSICYKGKIILAVGWRNGKAILTVGRR